MDVARTNNRPPLPGAKRHSFRARLHAWWEGYDLPPEDGGDAAAGQGADEPAAPAGGRARRMRPGEARGWSLERLNAAQRLFGAGSNLPGGDPFISELIKPLGLDATMSIVDLGAGIATMARAIAKQTGAWVDAVEPNGLLAQEAEELAKTAGLGKKATMLKVPLGSTGIKQHSRDAVVSREAFYMVPDKVPLFAEVKRLLKPGGQLLFTDIMRKGKDAPGAELKAWGNGEPADPHLIDIVETRQNLIKFSFDVRIAEDITERYCEMVMASLKDFAETLAVHPPSPEEKEWLLWEADYWARRVALLRGGGLGVYRVYARVPPSDSKG